MELCVSGTKLDSFDYSGLRFCSTCSDTLKFYGHSE